MTKNSWLVHLFCREQTTEQIVAVSERHPGACKKEQVLGGAHHQATTRSVYRLSTATAPAL